MRTDWYVFIAAGTFVGIFVYACIAWCLIAYRARPGSVPQRFATNLRLEILYAVLPLLLVAALFGVTLAVEMPVDRVAGPPSRIGVTAFQWSWRFSYPGGFSTTGTPAAPPSLYLPVGETTEIHLRSADVTHSFWVPAFLFKRDAIPGMINVFDLSPTRTGTFPARCAQFCGLQHANMTFVVRVVTRRDYLRYVATRGAAVP